MAITGSLLGTGEHLLWKTRALPGDRVGWAERGKPPSPADTGMGTIVWDRTRQPWLPVPPRPHRARDSRAVTATAAGCPRAGL